MIVEKARTPNTLLSALLIVFFSLVGMFIVILGIATAKVEKVNLMIDDDGDVLVSGRKGQRTITNSNEVVQIARAVKNGATYGNTILLGIVSFVIWFLIF